MIEPDALAEGLANARDRESRRSRRSLAREIFKDIIIGLLSAGAGALIGAYGAVSTFRHENAQIREQQRDLLFILCNTTVPERAVGLVRACEGVRNDPQLRAFVREANK